MTIRTALLEARYLWGDQPLFEELRKRFWAEIVKDTGWRFRRRQAGGARRSAISSQGESRYLVEPNVKEGKGGLRDLQTLYWIGKYLYHVDDAAELVEHNVLSREEYEHLPEGGEHSCGTCAASSTTSSAAPKSA